MCSELLLAEARHINQGVRSRLFRVSHWVEVYFSRRRIKLKDANTSPDESQDAGRKKIKRFAEFP